MLFPWTKKEALKFFLAFLAFFVLILAAEIPGFLSPLYWGLHPIAASFFAAGPLVYVMYMKKGPGSAIAIPLLWFILYKLMGELGMPLMWISALVLMVLSEVCHMVLGPEKPLSIRVAAVLGALATSTSIWPMYFQKEQFLSAALEEMDPDYVAGLAKYNSPILFVVMILGSIATACLSIYLTEKIFKLNESA